MNSLPTTGLTASVLAAVGLAASGTALGRLAFDGFPVRWSSISGPYSVLAALVAPHREWHGKQPHVQGMVNVCSMRCSLFSPNIALVDCEL